MKVLILAAVAIAAAGGWLAVGASGQDAATPTVDLAATETPLADPAAEPTSPWLVESVPDTNSIQIIDIEVTPGLGTEVQRGDTITVRVTFIDSVVATNMLGISVFALSRECSQAAGFDMITPTHDGQTKTVELTGVWDPYEGGIEVASNPIRDVIVLPAAAGIGAGNRSMADCLHPPTIP